MATLKINNVEMPCPSSLKWTLSTYDLESSRGVDGTMQRQVICHKEKLDLSWNSAKLTTTEIAQILNAVLPTFIQVTYFSPLANAYVTKEMYVSDRNLSFYRVVDGKPVIDNITFSLVER